jgi:hypothetical protein
VGRSIELEIRKPKRTNLFHFQKKKIFQNTCAKASGMALTFIENEKENKHKQYFAINFNFHNHTIAK